MAFVAIKIGRRQGARRERLDGYATDPVAAGRPPANFHRNPSGRAFPWADFSALLTPHVSISVMLVANANPARAVLKNPSRRTSGESHVISGIEH
jgi:hypothetical protein